MNQTDLLQQSSADCVALGDAIETKFMDLAGTYHRVKGIDISIPAELGSAFILWRVMRKRHKHGDFRNTESEWTAMTQVGRWLLDMNADLRNQPRPKWIV